MSPDPRADADGAAEAAIVTVLFHPSDDDLANLTHMAGWGARIFAIVNAIAEERRSHIPPHDRLTVIANPGNVGLARALNQGLSAAMEGGAAYVLLLDQDSRPTGEMFESLIEAAKRMEGSGRAVACVAPVLRDQKLGGEQCGPQPSDIVGRATFATSGTLITHLGWRQVGPMWEDLFIDGIDHEWCFRAKARGLEAVIVPDAVLMHDMGEAAVKVLGRFRPIHRSPIRHYFIVRNLLWLARRSYIPWRWRLAELVKLVYRVPTYLLVSQDKGRTASYIAAAIVDGLGQTTRRQPVGASRAGSVIAPMLQD